MDQYYTELEECDDLGRAVGEVYFDESINFFLVPFLHSGVKYLTYFTAVVDTQDLTLDVFKVAIENNVENHKVGDNPYVFKFGLKNNFDSGDKFGVGEEQKISKLLFTLPKKLAICIMKLMDKTNAIEFYFLPGSNDEEHQRKLGIWYNRISNKLAAQHGLAPIHEDTEGGWYGYKTNN